MKSWPPLIWIFGVFGILAFGTIIYARTQPAPLPTPKSTWDQTRELKTALETRQTVLAAHSGQEADAWPYHVTVTRLDDLEMPDRVARYVIRVRPDAGAHTREFSLTRSLDTAWLDLQPSSPSGRLQLVAVREPKIEETP
jgi:hypothetical protein